MLSVGLKVNIWEERRVFGSRGQSLREELLGKGPQSPKQEAKQSSSLNNQVRVLFVEKNVIFPKYFNVFSELTEFAGLKVFEGTLLERVEKSYQAAQEKAVDEYGALSKCSAALSLVVSLEKEAEHGAANGIWKLSILFTVRIREDRLYLFEVPFINEWTMIVLYILSCEIIYSLMRLYTHA